MVRLEHSELKHRTIIWQHVSDRDFALIAPFQYYHLVFNWQRNSNIALGINDKKTLVPQPQSLMAQWQSNLIVPKLEIIHLEQNKGWDF